MAYVRYNQIRAPTMVLLICKTTWKSKCRKDNYVRVVPSPSVHRVPYRVNSSAFRRNHCLSHKHMYNVENEWMTVGSPTVKLLFFFRSAMPAFLRDSFKLLPTSLGDVRSVEATPPAKYIHSAYCYIVLHRDARWTQCGAYTCKTSRNTRMRRWVPSACAPAYERNIVQVQCDSEVKYIEFCILEFNDDEAAQSGATVAGQSRYFRCLSLWACLFLDGCGVL